jgi:hypothetical protein
MPSFGIPKSPRRIIPIQKRNTLEFRFVGGQLNVEPSGSTIVWASCMTQESSEQKTTPPKFQTRSLGSMGGVVTFRVAAPLKFSAPCSEDLSRQTKDRKKVRSE